VPEVLVRLVGHLELEELLRHQDDLELLVQDDRLLVVEVDRVRRPIRVIPKIRCQFRIHSFQSESSSLTCCTGAFLRGPPGLGGESRGLSPVGNQSFFTGAGIGVVYVDIEISPKRRKRRMLMFLNEEATFMQLTNNSQSFLASVIHSEHFFAFQCFFLTFLHHLCLERREIRNGL